ncbi:transcription antitermination factor NusB [Propionicimonas sp.]|uniref:transcription antitermination factor NusB n=1 Tax=Propionicimonas sp. TaxID=1955623 RepID=UPI00179F8744|nr:transcription antitermination factor NusB [Propionicimonas sp.]MBU3977372.1 transcription antitermination factor NusB [Actinomycetota bacterium]MBA3021296.1 transcription antitermination factor NusB [Propionicimonas sp.]MBU3985882.1 transcription antitermination factor NusB [Actinomycetota bacterium]MBU4008667.1 transcription antitermination factor NusB [Actinomycetota bacterium]MBU4066183.1 transcription antitermination factor NusB [Actinomycetota bacterium]
MADTEPTKRGSARTKARKRALDILFEADLRELAATEVLAAHLDENDPPVREFSVTIVEGVTADLDRIDELISTNLASGWTLGRIPRVDRNLARIAVYELIHTDTSSDVVLAEAVSLCQDLSTDESPAFLNGLLASVVAAQAVARG